MGKTRERRAVPTRTAAPSPEERARMIAEQAYRLAEQRGFVTGGEVEDWLTAERAVDERLAASRPS
jgi:hypothetical protein